MNKDNSASKSLKILHEISMKLRSNPLKPQFTQDFVDILEIDTGFELLAVLIKTGPGNTLKPLALSKQGQELSFLDYDKAYVQSKCSTADAGITDWVALNGQSVRTGNVMDDPRYFGIRDNIQSELCVPLVVGKEVIGVINTETSRSRAYTELDEQFLETAANHLALAIMYSKQCGLLTANGQNKKDFPIINMCSYCKNINEENDWIKPDKFLIEHFRVSHGICHTCFDRLEEDGFI